jgi:tRNA dimethylallyltransferase
MDITHYVDAARNAVGDILRRNRKVLVTGGSGFYLKAFFAPVADNVAVPAALRDELRQRLETGGVENLLEELHQLNPQGLGDLDVQNPRRVSRALERCLASGRTLAELMAEFAAQPSPFAGYEIKLCELVREKSALDARIEQRVIAMLQAGLVEEVKELVAKGLMQNPSAAKAIGYRETIEFLDGQLPADELAAKIVQNTRGLVKKQRTWVKTQLPPHCLVDAADAQIDQLFS